MNDYISHGLWLANMHAECRTEVSENELRAHLIKAVSRTHELAKQRDELAKLCNYNERVMKDLLQQRDELAAALEKLARLGNDPHYGNSIGNQIAIEALAKVGAGETAKTEGHNVKVSGPEAALSPEGRARLPGSAAGGDK